MIKGVIRQLSQEVINRIAAGEIVQKPYAVVKEMVENSIDAKSSQILVYLNGGGLDLIKIIDDGIGIHQDDFPLLCKRYATSKISVVEGKYDFLFFKKRDLKSLSSFGFRGEALASISYVSYLTVTSKQRSMDLGYQAVFRDSDIIQKDSQRGITPIGCNEGTIFEVENLFYNVGQRRNSISKLEEKKQILKLIQYFALHYQTILFKLFVDSHSEFNGVANQTREELMEQILKSPPQTYKSFEINSESYDCSLNITYSKVSAVKARKEFVLFINDRLVDCDSLKRSVEHSYQTCYLCINDNLGGYFIYISLKMNPNHVDPNVHPNKREVKFINEQEISTLLEQSLTEQLKDESQSKIYKMKQTQLQFPTSQDSLKQELSKSKVQPKQMVRIDPQLKTLDSFVQKIKKESIQGSQLSYCQTQNTVQPQPEQKVDSPKKQDYQVEKLQVQKLLMKANHLENQKFLSRWVYVGCITSNYIIVQYETKLLFVNSTPLLYHYYLNNIIQNLGELQTIVTNYVPEQQEISEYQASLLKDFLNIEFDHQMTKIPSFHIRTISDENLKYFFKQIAQIDLSKFCKNTKLDLQQDKIVFKAARELAEMLSFATNDGEESADKEQFDESFLTLIHQNREVWDSFYIEKVFPYLKQCVITSVDIQLYLHELIELQSIYQIFERC